LPVHTIARPWLVWPAVAFLLLVFALPIGLFLAGSVLDPTFSGAQFSRLSESKAFSRTLLNTFRIAATVTAVCVVFGYLAAIRIATLKKAYAATLIALIVLTVWISLLVRNYAWMVVLGRQGLLSRLLQTLGWIDAPTSFLYNEFAVIVAMTHILIPYMIIPTVASLHAIDKSYVRAAMSLGARPLNVFRRIILPLSMPGVATGAVIVFVMAMGFYVTPALTGGRGQMMVAMLIEGAVSNELNWGYAAAQALVLLVLTLLILYFYNRRYGVSRLWGGV
jgi:ABC-type spermidine/putrescine transport system permease subunit I